MAVNAERWRVAHQERVADRALLYDLSRSIADLEKRLSGLTAKVATILALVVAGMELLAKVFIR